MTNWKDVNAGEQYPAHDFNKDSILEGVLTEIRQNVGPNKSYLFVVEKKGGVMVSVWGSTVLDRIATLPEGALIRVEYLGDVKGKGPKPYKNYKIQVDKDTLPATPQDAKEEFDVPLN